MCANWLTGARSGPAVLVAVSCLLARSMSTSGYVTTTASAASAAARRRTYGPGMAGRSRRDGRHHERLRPRPGALAWLDRQELHDGQCDQQAGGHPEHLLVTAG